MLNAQLDVPLNDRFRLAAANGHTAKVLELLEDGATFDVDREGRTVLHLAAQFGHADTVAALLLNGCDVNTPDFAGHTPLHRASAEGHPDIVQQLVKHGARIDSQDDVHGNTALHEAAWKGYSQTLDVLCKAKANVYIKNKGGFAPLHLACQNGHNQSCRVLLLTGCRPDLKNNYGDTPMHTAARYGHAGVMRILISAGCKVSEQNKNGDTTLHISVAMGRRKLTRILLEANCDQTVRNKQGETSLHIARRKEFVEVQQLLLHPPSQRIPVQQATEKKSQKKREKGSGTSSKDSGSRHKEKHKKTKHGHKVHFPDKGKEELPEKWSPYGCHYYPNLASFPSPKLDSLPKDPLKKGEQYYLDLSGNIRKGPVGVNYACYCAPFFQHVEKKLEGDKQELIDHIEMARADLQTRMANLERRTRGRLMHLSQAMQEKLATEQVDCRERSDRRALQERMALEQQQEQCTDFVRTELKSWVQSKMDEFERNHYCQLHNPRDFARQSLPAHQCFRGGRRRRRTIARSRSEELLSDRCIGDDALSSSSANLGACAAELQPVSVHNHNACSPLGTKPKRPVPYMTNGDNGEDENDFVLNKLRDVSSSSHKYLETDFDGSFTSPDSGCNTHLATANSSGAGYEPNDGKYPAVEAVAEPEFKMTRQFYDTVSNEMEKWYERRLVDIEKKAELKVNESQDTIEGRILAIEEQLTKINESFSLSGGSRSASSLV